MIHVAAVIAWATLGIILYVYLGYPALLWMIGRFQRHEVYQEDITPSVSLIISAFNEARVIRAKLENSLALDYPVDRLDVFVVSDASTDDTNAIVKEYASLGVTLLRLPQRLGKTGGLNAVMQVVRSDIVVFSDANILYDKEAIRCLARNFADPAVGCVTGDSCYLNLASSAAHVQENTYWGYERLVRTLESRIGSTVGGDGAIFAIRRTLYTPLRAAAINDLVTPLQIVAQGYRAVFEPKALGFEPSAGNFKSEFRRKRRIVNRSWQGVLSMPEILNPKHVGLFAWQVWSHKLVRWLMLPLVVIAALSSSIASPLGLWYQLGMWGFIASLAVAGIGAWIPSYIRPLAQVAQACFYFYLINLAAVFGHRHGRRRTRRRDLDARAKLNVDNVF